MRIRIIAGLFWALMLYTVCQSRAVVAEEKEQTLSSAIIREFGGARMRTYGKISGIAYSTDGNLLAAYGKEMYVWDVQTMQRVAKYRVYLRGDTHRLSFSSDNKRLVIDQQRTLDLATGREEPLNASSLPGRSLPLDFGRNEMTLLLIAGKENRSRLDARLVVWDRRGNSKKVELETVFNAPGDIGAAFSPDGTLIAVATDNRGVEIYDATNGKLRKRFTPTTAFDLTGDRYGAPGMKSQRIQFSPSGEFVAINKLSEVDVWRVSNGEQVFQVRADRDGDGHSGDSGPPVVTDMKWMPNGSVLAASVYGYVEPGITNEVRIVAVPSGKIVKRIHGIWGALAFSPNGNHLAVGARSPTTEVRVWDTQTWTEIGSREGIQGDVRQLAFAPDGHRLASVTRAGEVHVWDATNGKELSRHQASGDSHISFGQDGWLLGAFSSIRKNLAAWETIDGDAVVHRKWTYNGKAAINAQLTRIAIPVHYERNKDPKVKTQRIGYDLSGLLSQAPAVRISAEIENSFENYTTVAFSPNGNIFATCRQTQDERYKNKKRRRYSQHEGLRAFIQLWDTKTGKRLARLESVPTAEAAASMLPPGTPKLRRRQTGLGYFRVAFSSDGLFLAATCQPGEIEIWDLTSGRILGLVRAGAGIFGFSPDGRLLGVFGTKGISLVETSTCRTVHVINRDDDSGELAYLIERPNYRNVRFLQNRSPAFSPDSTTLATAGRDASPIVICSLAPWDWDADKAQVPLSDKEAANLWGLLLKDDGEPAYRTIWRLARASNGADILAKRIKPTIAINDSKVAKLIEQLDSDNFTVREKATLALLNRVERLRPLLKESLAQTQSAEVRQRLKTILKATEGPIRLSRETIRHIRAIHVLERIGTPEAKTALKRLSKGNRADRRTLTAASALERLALWPKQ